MLVREFTHSDEHEILALFRIVFGTTLEPAYWRWRFLENPFGKGIVSLMLDNKRLVGHYAVIPMPLMVKGELHRAAFSMTTMTHPDYQGRGVFRELASDVYDQCREIGIELVFGFPNVNSYLGFTKRLGWKGLGRIKGWEGELIPAGGAHEVIFEEMRAYDHKLDDLWARVKDTGNIMVPRSAEFLKWRYFKKPGGEYTIYGAVDGSGIFQGLLVLKIFRGGSETVGHIVDCVTTNQANVHKAILNKALVFFAERKVKEVSCWFSGYMPIAKQLEATGFVQKEWQTYFGARVLDQRLIDASFAANGDNWRLTMGDSDVY
jgi:GNAT superfamily N-acetyltransferase